MGTVSHTEAIRKLFGAAVDRDSASIAYQANQLAQKLDKTKEDLVAASWRADGYVRDIQRALASANPLDAQPLGSMAALLAQTATECAQLAAQIEALDVGLFALVRAVGKGNGYTVARVTK